MRHVTRLLIAALSLAALSLAAALALPGVAAAQPWRSGDYTPTMDEPPPGVDNTGRDVELPPELRRTPVFYRSGYPAGTIIVNTNDRFLYLIQSDTLALRYGIGVGRDGFQWSGTHTVTRKAEWPDWTPPPEMIERQPYLPRFMAGGPGNPMGAAALYIGNTVYRIHGTNAPETIGQAVSSGCFRLVNEDIQDLYARVPIGTKVVVQHQ